MQEIWKDIPGYEGIYEVSNKGRIRSIDRIVVTKAGWTQTKYGQVIKFGQPINSGYIKVDLHKNGKAKPFLVHRIVAEVFLENPNGCETVNHKDENKLNNSADNLEWCTQMYNNNYGTCKERGAETQRREFLQMDMDGNVIKRWKGFKKIQRELGYQRKLIYLCCIGKRESYMGYKWCYA